MQTIKNSIQLDEFDSLRETMYVKVGADDES